MLSFIYLHRLVNQKLIIFKKKTISGSTEHEYYHNLLSIDPEKL